MQERSVAGVASDEEVVDIDKVVSSSLWGSILVQGAEDKEFSCTE